MENSWESYLPVLIKDATVSDLVIRDAGDFVYLVSGSKITPIEKADALKGSAAFSDLVTLFKRGRIFLPNGQATVIPAPEILAGGKTAEGAAVISGTRYRWSLAPFQLGWEVTMRRFPDSIMTVEQAGLPQALVDEILGCRSGLILATGATGSGKSTSLAAVLWHMGQAEARRVITLEDPIEYEYPQTGKSLFTQREIGRDDPSFHMAVERAMRMRPHDLVIGEIRDGETAEAAFRLAMTGHRVFGTMHTETPASAVDYLIELIPKERRDAARYVLAQYLKVVWAQQLIPNPETRRFVPIHEILFWSEAVKQIIRSGNSNSLSTVIDNGRQRGMQRFEHARKAKIESGELPAW